MRKSIWTIAGLITALLPCGAQGQSGLQSAGGTTSLLSRELSTVSVETEANSLTVLLESGVLGLPETWQSNFRASIAASDSRRDLFRGGRWVPGLELEERLAYVWNRGDFYDGRGGGYTATFLSLGYAMEDNALARAAEGAALQPYDRTSHTTTVGLGFNWAPRELGPVFGTSASVGWSRGTPVAGRTSQVCTGQVSGVDGDGNPVRADRCESRFLGGVHDTRTGHLRVDVTSPRVLFPAAREARARAQASLQKLDATLGLPAGSSYADRLEAVGRRMKERADAMAPFENAIRDTREAHEKEWTAAQTGDPEALRRLSASYVRLREAQERGRTARAEYDAARQLQEDLQGVVEVLADQPMLTLLASASAKLEEGDKPTYNLAAGPLLHPPFTPLKVVAGMLFELEDLNNARGDHPDWRDRFAIRLYLGVPF